MYCARCGTRNDDANRFCLRCGTALVSGAPGAPLVTLSPTAVPGAPPPRPVAGLSPAVRIPGPIVAAGATGYGTPVQRGMAAAVDALAVWVLSGAAQSLLGVEHSGAGLFVTLFVLWFYFAASESSGWAATPGKRMMELRVVDRQGEPLSFGAASGRFFGKVLAALLFGVGLAMIFFDDEHQGMHDAMAESWVVHD